jgi:Type II CAAX prenyl endopeptidase Rce1-like
MNPSRTQPEYRPARLRDGDERWSERRTKGRLYIETEEPSPPGYWSSTRRPLPSLALVGPIVLAYEGGVVWLGGASPQALRTGADAWMRRSLAELGLTDHWFLPLALLMILLGWQAVRPKEWRFSPMIIAGMLVESLVLAVCLVGVSRLVDIGFSYLERTGPTFRLLQAAPSSSRGEMAQLIGFLGAGVYEEALFRLLLVPIFFYALRLLQTPQVPASALAVTGSALLFSLAHHAGNPGETFTWFAFVFRWMAGVFFAWIFILRGFGIAVGAHTAYDILVGWVGWQG